MPSSPSSEVLAPRFYSTREEWLEAGARELLREFPQLAHKAEKGATPIKVSVGWPRGVRKAIGQCYAPSASDDKRTAHIFISPSLYTGAEALETLAHELVHVATPGAGHRKEFIKIAKVMGFLKPWKSTPASEGLKERLTEVLGRVGPYPHVGLMHAERRKQPTRMLLYECSEGVKIRHAGVHLNARCQDCGTLFKLKGPGASARLRIIRAQQVRAGARDTDGVPPR